MTHRLFVDLSELKEFHHVDASFAAFALRKEGMRSAYEGAYFVLCQICLLTGGDQPF